LAFFSALAGCGGGGSSANQGPPRTVQGTSLVTYVTDSGVQTVPNDTTKFTIAALVPDGSGGYTTIPGTGSPTGSFTIPNVPAGNYLLQYGCCVYFSTNSSSPDTGWSQLGRANRESPTQPSEVTLAISGANPFQSTDGLQLSVSNTGANEVWDGTHLSGINLGSTSFSPSLEWTSYLTDTTQGDTAYVSQLTNQPAAGYIVRALKEASGPLSFTQADGGISTVTAPLSDVPQTGSVHLAYQGSAFAALVDGMNPRGELLYTRFFFDVDPANLNLGSAGGTPDLIVFGSDNGPIRSDIDLGNISFGNPFPAAWQPYLRVDQYTQMSYALPGNNTYNLAGVIHVSVPASQSAALAPIVGPVANPRINGQNFFSDNAGVGTTPTLSWSAPQVGTATGYRIYVVLLYDGAQKTISDETVAKFYTAGNGLRLPPNVLVAGNSYLIVITAASDPAYDITQSPYRGSIPFGTADALSGLITP
jgi:hypothetical protein